MTHAFIGFIIYGLIAVIVLALFMVIGPWDFKRHGDFTPQGELAQALRQFKFLIAMAVGVAASVVIVVGVQHF
jgi:hypothetical protein